MGGQDVTAGEFTGFVQGATGHLVLDATVVDVVNQGGAGVAYDAANIIANLDACVAAIPTAVYTKEDLHIYMSPKTYRIYLGVQAAAGYQQLYNMGDAFVPMFNGIKLAVCTGMNNDVLVAAEKSNLFFGTDLVSDAANINLLDLSQLDGSSNMRLICRYSGGTQVGIGADVVLVS